MRATRLLPVFRSPSPRTPAPSPLVSSAVRSPRWVPDNLRPRLRLHVDTVVGRAGSRDALADARARAGIDGCELVSVGSVIPAGVEIVEGQGSRFAVADRSRMYSAFAALVADRPGASAWVGVGWVRAPHDGWGVFVTASGASEDLVHGVIDRRLREQRTVFGLQNAMSRIRVCGGTVRDQPICTLALCAFVPESQA